MTGDEKHIPTSTSGPPRALTNVNEVKQLLADYVGPQEIFRYYDMDVSIIRSGPSGWTSILLSPWIYAIARRFFDVRFGLFAEIIFPAPLGIDLRMESRDIPEETATHESTIDRYFHISVTNRALLDEELDDALRELLINWVKQKRRALVTDTVLRMGPLSDALDRAAEEIVAICDTVSAAFGAGQTVPESHAIDEPTVIKTTLNRFEADLYRSMLETAGIPSMSVGYEQSPPWGSATPPREIQIVVSGEDAPRARHVISQHDAD